MALLGAISLATEAASAQAGRGASASVRIPAVLQIRSVSLPAVRVSAPGTLELVQQVTTSANIDYVMNAVGVDGLEVLERQGMRVTVRTASGGFSPLRAGLPILASRGRRGAASLTSVVVHVEGVPGRIAAHSELLANELRALLGFQAAVEESSGALVVSQTVPSAAAAANVAGN